MVDGDEEGITRNCINERGSCFTGPSPCSSTQNMPHCSAHVSLLHARNGEGGGLGEEGGSAGGQRVAGKGAAGCQSVQCCQAHRHEHATHTSKYACLL